MKSLMTLAAATACGAALLGGAGAASAQSEPILGQVTLFATSWCPRGWLPANGATLQISSYSALFALYGTTYGGDGQTTFKLPDLSDRAPISWSSTHPLGAIDGQSTVTLTTAQMPAHTHAVVATSAPTSTNSPAGGVLGTFPAGQMIYAPNTSTPDVPMHAGIVSTAGGSQPFSVQSPVLAMNWCVAVNGVFPSRP